MTIDALVKTPRFGSDPRIGTTASEVIAYLDTYLNSRTNQDYFSKGTVDAEGGRVDWDHPYASIKVHNWFNERLPAAMGSLRATPEYTTNESLDPIIDRVTQNSLNIANMLGNTGRLKKLKELYEKLHNQEGRERVYGIIDTEKRLEIQNDLTMLGVDFKTSDELPSVESYKIATEFLRSGLFSDLQSTYREITQDVQHLKSHLTVREM